MSGYGLGGFAPMIRAHTATAVASASRLSAPVVTATADSISVLFTGIGPIDPARSSAYARSARGSGSPGRLAENTAGRVRFAFDIPHAGAARVAVSLTEAESEAVSGGVFDVAVAGDAALELAGVHPNPSRGDVTAVVSLGRDAAVALDLVDALGRTVARWPARDLPRGRSALPLDMPPLAPGLYHLRIQTHDGRSSASRTVPLTRVR